MTPVALALMVVVAVVVIAAYNVRHLVTQQPLEREWTQVADVEPDRNYLAVLTYYPLKAGQRTSQVVSYVRLVQRRLDQSEGVIGYALRANFYRQRLWTLSVWTDDAALQAFLQDVAHQQASDDLADYVVGSETRQWWLAGRDVPPSWDDALAQLENPSAEPARLRAPERDTSGVG